MSSRYQKIWETIKKNPKGTTTIVCKPAKMQTIIRMVQKVKSAENSVRHALETESYGVLKAQTFPNGTIKFRLVPSFRSYEL